MVSPVSTVSDAVIDPVLISAEVDVAEAVPLKENGK
jgi:hypothetical protein